MRRRRFPSRASFRTRQGVKRPFASNFCSPTSVRRSLNRAVPRLLSNRPKRAPSSKRRTAPRTNSSSPRRKSRRKTSVFKRISPFPPIFPASASFASPQATANVIGSVPVAFSFARFRVAPPKFPTQLLKTALLNQIPNVKTGAILNKIAPVYFFVSSPRFVDVTRCR